MAGRAKRNRKFKPVVAFLVEGQTEEAYFNRFKQEMRLTASSVVQLLDNQGKNWLEKANNQLKNNSEFAGVEITAKVLLFDVDVYDTSTADSHIQNAIRDGYLVGYSNPSFELWLLAHFEKITGASLSGDEISRRLNKHLGMTYVKNDSKVIGKIWDAIGNDVTIPVENAGSDGSNLDTTHTMVGEVVKKIINRVGR